MLKAKRILVSERLLNSRGKKYIRLVWLDMVRGGDWRRSGQINSPLKTQGIPQQNTGNHGPSIGWEAPWEMRHLQSIESTCPNNWKTFYDALLFPRFHAFYRHQNGDWARTKLSTWQAALMVPRTTPRHCCSFQLTSPTLPVRKIPWPLQSSLSMLRASVSASELAGNLGAVTQSRLLNENGHAGTAPIFTYVCALPPLLSEHRPAQVQDFTQLREKACSSFTHTKCHPWDTYPRSLVT